MSSCHFLDSFLTVGKYLDLSFRLSVLGLRLSALGFRFSALVFRLLALGSGFQPFSGDWLSLSEKKGFLLFQDDFYEGKRQYSGGFELFVVLKKLYLGCAISWQPINRSIGHQIETQISRFGLSSQSWN